METQAHQELKRLAVAWALEHRLAHCATEVPLPRCAYRADVAAATPRVLGEHARTAVFECKASRADFRRDGADERALRETIEELAERVQSLRALIGQHCPDLRRGEELFPDFEAVDLRGVTHETHARLSAQLRVAQAKLFAGTKFCKLTRWRAASFLYLVVEDGIVDPRQVPDGWGLLVRRGTTLELVLKPCLNVTTREDRVTFLERLASAATRETARRAGLLEFRSALATPPSGSR